MNATPQNGFTLTEVLISIFVLAIGILGTAGLQLAAFRTSHDSALHGAAMQIAASIAESLRAGDRGAAGPSLYPELDYRAGSGAEQEAEAEAGIGCYASDCDAARLSEFDIEQWKAWIRKELPGGRLRICRDSDPWDDARKSYRWECASLAPGADKTAIKIGWQEKRDIGYPFDAQEARRDFAPEVVILLDPRAR